MIDTYEGINLPEYVITVAFAFDRKFLKLIHNSRKKTNYSIYV